MSILSIYSHIQFKIQQCVFILHVNALGRHPEFNMKMSLIFTLHTHTTGSTGTIRRHLHEAQYQKDIFDR